MNDDAIPEFSTRRDAFGRIVSVTAVCEISPPPKHHPDCAECCAIGRCHWCLNRPQTGTITSTGPDGFIYAACTTHHRYFTEMQHRQQPHAGVDLTAGLQAVEISPVSPLVR